MTERVFVFTESKRSAGNSFRGAASPRKYAIRESEIKMVRTQVGTTSLVVNDLDVVGDFDELVSLLGERVDIK
jgi:hypothetical protein